MTIPPEQTDPLMPTEPIKPGPAPGQPTGTAGSAFQSFMQGPPTPKAPPAATPPVASVTPPPTQALPTPTVNSVSSQRATSQDSMTQVRNQLNTYSQLRNQLNDQNRASAPLSRSQENLLRNKLSDANTYLRAAGTKMGAEMPPETAPSTGGPLEKLLGYVTSGETQLVSARNQLNALAKSGKQLNPADFLLIQVKLNQAEQEIAYASTLLGRAISALNQLLTTQL